MSNKFIKIGGMSKPKREGSKATLSGYVLKSQMLYLLHRDNDRNSDYINISMFPNLNDEGKKPHEKAPDYNLTFTIDNGEQQSYNNDGFDQSNQDNDLAF